MHEANHLIMIQYQKNYWRVMYPTSVLENEELFQKGKSLHISDPPMAEKIYRQVMVNCGELYIDAISHLGILLNQRSEGTGLTYIVQAFSHSRALFPKEFDENVDFLPYESRGNAFVLNAYYLMAEELKKVRRFPEALELYEFLLKINPKDNHGAARWVQPLKDAINKTT